MRAPIIAILTVVLLAACHDKQAQWTFKETIEPGEIQPNGTMFELTVRLFLG